MPSDIQATPALRTSLSQFQTKTVLHQIPRFRFRQPAASTDDRAQSHPAITYDESYVSRVALITNSRETAWYGAQIFEALGHPLEVAMASDIPRLREARIPLRYDHVIIDAHTPEPLIPCPAKLVTELKSHNPRIKVIAGVPSDFRPTRKRVDTLPLEIVDATVPIPFTVSNVASLLASINQLPRSEQTPRPPVIRSAIRKSPKQRTQPTKRRDANRTFKDRFIEYFSIDGTEVSEIVVRNAIASPGNTLIRLLPKQLVNRLFRTELECVASAISQHDLLLFIREARRIHTINKSKQLQFRMLLGLRLSVSKLTTLGCMVFERHESPGHSRDRIESARKCPTQPARL